jgi:CzcA family heavy metal efflux pump
MMRSIVRSSLSFRFLVIVVAGVMMVLGAAQIRAMPVDILPEFTPPYVEIQTEAIGLSAEEVEQLITVPMEQDLFNGVPWLDVIRSESTPGLSSIDLFFEPGTDLYRARQMVTERLAQAFALPHVSKTPTMIQPLSSSSRFMIIGLSSDDLSLIEMSVQARWTIGPRLLGVPGVSNVAIWGNRDRQLQVQVDPKRLVAQDVSLLQVLETTGNALWVSTLSFVEASTPGTGGFIDTPLQRLGIRHLSPILSADDLAQVPIEGTKGLRLVDVAAVVEDHQPLIGDAIVNDEPSLLIVVEKLPGANTLQVTQGVEEALGALQPGMPAIKFDTNLYRPATFIEMAIANLSKSLLIATILLVIGLLLFLWDWRSALISFVAIPISLITALFVLYQRGATVNALLFAGLVVALGAVIDDALVDVENIVRRLRQHRQAESGKSVATIILEASFEVRDPIFYGVLIMVLTLILVVSVGNLSGAFFQPLIFSYVLAIVASMLVALIVTPALSMILFSTAQFESRESPLMVGLRNGFERIIARVLQSPRLVYLIIGALVVIGIITILPFAKADQLLPSFNEPYITVQMVGAPGTSRAEMDRIISPMSTELRGIAGVSNVGAHVGRAIFGDQVVSINSAELWVNIDPKANYDSTVASVRKTVNGYPGFQYKFQTYLTGATSGVMAKPGDSLTIRVYGQDYELLQSQAEKIREALTGVNGIVDSKVELPINESTLEIKVDITKAQQFGIKPGDVRRAAAIMLSGLQVGSLFEEQKVFDVVVWSTPETRNSVSDIHELLIDTPSGGHVRLGDVAEVSMRPVPSLIEHEAVSRFLDIDVRVSGRSLRSVASDITRTLSGITSPLEYHAEVIERFAEQRAMQERRLATGILAVIGMFLILQAAFGNWRLATATIFTLPITIVGGLLAAFLSGNLLTIGTIVGLLTILGIATRNSIMQVSHYQLLEDQEGETFGLGLVLLGSRERVAPILMTALTTGLLFLPFVLFGNVPGLEIVHPMAIAVLGGLVTSTLYNLLALPTLYLSYGASREADLGLESITEAQIGAVASD